MWWADRFGNATWINKRKSRLEKVFKPFSVSYDQILAMSMVEREKAFEQILTEHGSRALDEALIDLEINVFEDPEQESVGEEALWTRVILPAEKSTGVPAEELRKMWPKAFKIAKEQKLKSQDLFAFATGVLRRKAREWHKGNLRSANR